MDGRRIMHCMLIAMAVTAFVLVVLAVISEASSDSDAGTLYFKAGASDATVNDRTNPGDNQCYNVSISNWNWQTTSVTMPTSNPTGYVYARSGYWLAGWSDREGSTKIDYEPEKPYDISGAWGSKYVYAVWKPYTITFDPNNGTVSPSSYTASVNTTLVVPNGSEFSYGGKNYVYSREGYAFLGWSTNPNATQPQPEYASGRTMPRPTQDYSLYAVWDPHTITFHPNGGHVSYTEGQTTVIDTHYYVTEAGKSLVVPGNRFSSDNVSYYYYNDGNTFLGWSYNQYATSADYGCGDVLDVPTSDCDIYAVWASGSYFIFDPNKDGSVTPDKYQQTSTRPLYVPGGTFKADGTTYTYTKTECTFVGWSTSKVAESPEYIYGNVIEMSDTGYVLYAVWVPSTYTVTFVYDDTYSVGVEVELNYPFDTIAYMNLYTPSNLSGYNIVGWMDREMVIDDDSKDDNGAYLLPAGATTHNRKIKLTTPGNITLYPIWGLHMDVGDDDVEITDGSGCYYITGTSKTHGIIVSGGSPLLFVDEVNIDFGTSNLAASSKTLLTGSPFIIKDNAEVTLTIMGDSYFKGADNVQTTLSGRTFSSGCAAINVRLGTTLTVSKDSLGKLTATGGNAVVINTSNNRNDDGYHRARSGAGIGSNGNPGNGQASNVDYDGGCGTIIINGGVISATGGDCIVDRGVRSGNNYTYRTYYGMVASQGIGGTLGNNDSIHIVGGTIKATTGQIYGKYKARQGATQYEEGTLIVDSTALIYRPPIFDGDDGDKTTIEDTATVTEVTTEGGTINIDSVVVVFTVSGGDTIGSATNMTIDGVVFDISGMSISDGTTFEVDINLVHEGSKFILVTGHNHYFEGTAQSITSGDGDYSVYLNETNATPHGKVFVYANKAEINGNENFGSIDPYQGFTISGSVGEEKVVCTFTLNLNESYECTGILIDRDDGSGFQPHDIEPNDGESEYHKGNIWTFHLALDILPGADDGSGGAINRVSFTIEKVKVKVVIHNQYSEDDEMTFPNGIVAPTDAESPTISWDSGNRTGTQYVYFKDNMTYTLNMDRGSSNNPFNVSRIVANNERLVPVYSNDNDGKYTLTVTDISEETHIYITYVPTVKITAYDPVLTDATNSSMRIKVIDSQGGDGWWLQRSNNGYFYAYVNAGSSAYFKIVDISTGSSTIWHGISLDTGEDAILGVSDIQVRIGSDPSYPMDATVNNIYEIEAVTDDTVVTSDLSCIKWDVTFVSTTPAGPSTFIIEVINGARLHITTKDQLTSVGLNDKDGYALDGWNATGGDQDYYTPGTTIRVYNHMNLNADWGDPIDYVIKADLGSGFVNFATYKITTGYTMGDVTRRGYDFVGWVDADTPNETPRKNYPIAAGTFGERSFIAVWNALPVHVIMYDDMQEEVLDEGDFIFGQPYSNLPIFSMYEDPQTHEIYSFVGWGLKDETTGVVTQITSSTLVDIETTHTIYIIWWKEGFYVLNITNDGSYGGTVTANLVGQQGDAIALIITMYSGFIATNVNINGQDFPITPNSNPYTYSGFITSTTVYYYVITVTFEPTTGIPIPSPELYSDSAIYYIYDGTVKTGYKSRDGYYMLIESVDDDWHNTGTNAGTYYVTARLVPPYIWDDGTNLDKRLEWTIDTRKAYIVAHSETEFYTGSAFTIPTNMYSLVSVVPSDLTTVGGVVRSIVYDSRTVQDVGWYIIDISFDDNLDNYEFTVIKGTFIVVKSASSSVSVRIVSPSPATNNSAPSPNMVNMAESGWVMAIVSVSGRREGE